jgi:ABC-2 type transport system ATP-binding protein
MDSDAIQEVNWMGAIIEVEGITKRYGARTAVEDVSFQVREGEVFGILGPNGAGKTTTVEILQGLRAADAGRIRVLGLDPQRQTRELRRRIGSQLQESALPDRIKVREALDLFASVTPRATDWQVLMDRWGLAEKANATFASLSGGQRQRLFVALALVGAPEVVFLDELTQGLDPGARRVAWNLIEEIRDAGTTVVLVTHYMDEAEQLCDRVAVVDRGRVIALGPPQELIARSGLPLTVRFSGDHQDLSWLDGVDHVEKVIRRGDAVEVRGTGPVLAVVASELVSHGLVPDDLRAEQPDLEDVFLQLTGRTERGL